MSDVLIIAEHDGQRLNPSTASCVTCALGIPEATITVVVCAADVAAVAAQAAALRGVTHVVTLEHPAHAHALAAMQAPQLAQLATQYSHVLAPSTTFGKDLLPRIAALIDAPQISDIMAVESATRFRRPIYAGNVIVTVEIAAGTKITGTVRVASFAAAPSGGSASVHAGRVDVPLPTHTRFISVSSAQSERPDLQSAARVVSGGRAFGSAANFAMLYTLADKIGAAVGASRAAVDAGYAPNELQVGQTGKIIAPEVYFAIGISGAIQHLTGIKDARTIVAINKDAEAPIFEVADIGLVADIFQALPELEKLLATE